MIDKCPICGGERFEYKNVLWKELISEWGLSPYEIEYINRQQGLYCEKCKNNLRVMALANAIVKFYNYDGNLVNLCEDESFHELKILELNEAGELSKFLNVLPGHEIAMYPDYDMQNLSFNDNSYDLIIHSDTLEHVEQPVKGLCECRRILKSNGGCIYTVPIIIGRISRSRKNLGNSYHGEDKRRDKDLLVCTEFGADVWRYPLEAGFSSAKISCLEFPSALAIELKK